MVSGLDVFYHGREPVTLAREVLLEGQIAPKRGEQFTPFWARQKKGRCLQQTTSLYHFYSFVLQILVMLLPYQQSFPDCCPVMW